MVRGDARQSSAHYFELEELQGIVIVDVIQLENRHQSGKASPSAPVLSGMDLVELFDHQLRCEPARPLVEITEDYPRTTVAGMVQHPLAEQQRPLGATLPITRSQMHVEYMQQGAFQPQIGPQTSTCFA